MCFDNFAHISHTRTIMNIIESIFDGIEDLTQIRLSLQDLKDIQLSENELIDTRYDLMTILLIYVSYKKGELNINDVKRISSIFEIIRKLQLATGNGDEDSKLLFDAIEKLAKPPKMRRNKKAKTKPFLPGVKDLLEKKSSPHLKRAYEIRRLMSELSFIVEPVNVSKLEILESLEANPKLLQKNRKGSQKINSNKLESISKIKVREKPVSSRIDLIEEVNKTISNLEEAASAKLTFVGLAKKIYLERAYQKDANSNLTERELNRCIQYLNEFEKQNPEEIESSNKLPIYGGEHLSYKNLT